MSKTLSTYHLSNVLLEWLQSLNVDGPQKTLHDLCDGVALAQALHQIAPEWFSKIWLSRIKTEVGTNWRLKVSNIKKIIESIIDYYQEYFNHTLIDAARPDALKIAEHQDTAEIIKLLQLIIGCAVNCNRKQEYIESIMLLEESVQNVIMQCIQELENSMGCPSLSFTANLNVDYSDMQIQNLITELQSMKILCNQLKEKCADLDMQVNVLKEEKSTILYDKKRLEEQWQEETSDPMKDNILRKQIEHLKDEIFRLETFRDDYRLKFEIQEKQLIDLQLKYDALQQTAAQARHLKDEVDILRDNADKVEKLESTIQSYKKKLESMSEMKREMKLLENKNFSYIKQTMELEEELKKSGTWKLQLETYKKQISELRQTLTERTNKFDKIEFDYAKLQEKFTALQEEKERIEAEREILKEKNEELLCNKQQFAINHQSLLPIDSENGEVIMSTMDLKHELAKLQLENNLLKQNQDEKNPMLQLMVDDMGQQNQQLQNQCRKSNQRILELEAELKELSEKNEESLTDFRIEELQKQIIDKERELSDQKQLMTMIINQKNQEIQNYEDRHKITLDKVRLVAKTFDCPINSDLYKTVNKLTDKRNKLVDSDNVINQKLQNSNASGNTCTFLGKQRQSSTRRVP